MVRIHRRVIVLLALICDSVVVVSSLAAELPVEQERWSYLRPWKHTSSSSTLLGWTRETRNANTKSYQVAVGWKDVDDEVRTGGVHSSNDVRIITSQDLEEAVVVSLPYLDREDSLASSLWPGSLAAAILCRSPTFRQFVHEKKVLELGAGLGLTGMVASEDARSCRLTDNDGDVIQAVNEILQSVSNKKRRIQAEMLDWRDNHSADEKIDVIVASDVAYYYYLLRPLMDTTRSYLQSSNSLWLAVGQANREAQWQLYHNLLSGCYNQVTDQYEDPWPGSTEVLLYDLDMYQWQPISEGDSTKKGTNHLKLDGTLPIAAMVYQTPDTVLKGPWSSWDHVATVKDEESMFMTF